MNKGFTLVELSIVLVIIGLLVGGVLVGQSLIDSAKLNATVQQFQQFDAGAFAFKAKYKALPGDFGGGFPVATLAPDPASRDNLITDNDRINNTTRYAAAGSEEYMLFWLDMVALSGFKLDNCTNFITRSSPFSGGHGVRVTGADCNFPKLKYGGTETTAIPAAVDLDNNPIYAANSTGNAYYIFDKCILNGAGPEFSCGPAFTHVQAIAFDAKMDDGISNTGDVVAISNATITSVRMNGKTIVPAYNTALTTKVSLIQKFAKGL